LATSGLVDAHGLASTVRLKFSTLGLAFVVGALALALVPFAPALAALFQIWNVRPEYSHGVLIPVISAFLIWRERAWLARAQFTGSWSALALIVGGALLLLAGELAAIPAVVQYGFLFVLYGVIFSLTGPAVFRHLWMPLLILIFMIPLPASMGGQLSLQMQLISSWIGVALIRLWGISVFLEGNVIDLGVYQLQVAEACDGLRYMFPLMTLAFILSYFMKAPVWKRVVLFLSSIPISILMNSFRIGVIGITVEYWGTEMAEGLLHDFEGWVVFMISTVALVGVAALLMRLGGERRGLHDMFAIDTGAPLPREGSTAPRRIPASFFAATALTATATVIASVLPNRVEMPQPRPEMSGFPTNVSGWQGRRERLQTVYADALKLDDYVMTTYSRNGAGAPVNLYVAYYDSQRSGRATHSPRYCIPGGGWKIRSLEPRTLDGIKLGNEALRVNRTVIELGMQKQIVYYWFMQRGRIVTNEYLVKWYIFWDALTRNRTDGALVRLTAMVPANGSEAATDIALKEFAKETAPLLTKYVPN
jgi:exosortase D (VPLPA-CTERM-specific)